MIEFIFMLTHDDVTVERPGAILAELRDTGLRCVGFKDIGQPESVLAAVTADAHTAGMEVMLEVVSTSVDAELRSLRAGLEIGVDWILGGTHAQDGAEILAGTQVRYWPFPGVVEGHPSVLKGEISDIARHAAQLSSSDAVYGVDLLAYRHEQADPVALTRAVVEAVDGPVIAAGSVASLAQIAALDAAGAWGFTIGGAIFEGQLPGGPTVAGQVAAVLNAAAGAEVHP